MTTHIMRHEHAILSNASVDLDNPTCQKRARQIAARIVAATTLTIAPALTFIDACIDNGVFEPAEILTLAATDALVLAKEVLS